MTNALACIGWSRPDPSQSLIRAALLEANKEERKRAVLAGASDEELRLLSREQRQAMKELR